MSSKSAPSWVEAIEGQSFVQVLKPSVQNENVIIGARQFVKAVAVTESGLSTLRSVKSSSAGITAAAFHPTADSVMIAAGSNGEVSVFNFGAQNLAALYEKWTAHSRAIHGADFLPLPSNFKRNKTTLPGHADKDSAMLLTVSADGEINCWDMCAYTGKKETWRKPIFVGNLRGEGLKSGLRDLDVRLKNEKYEVLVVCEDGSVELYVSLNLNPVTLSLSRRLSVSSQTVNSVRFRPDKSTRRFATGGKDGYVRVFEFNSNYEMQNICSIRSQSPVWAVRWRPGFDGSPKQYIASCQSVMDSCIYVWDLDSRLMPAYVMNSHRDNVTDFFWADRNHIISCSRDNTVQMHAIKNAIIPIERMRTVNIAVSVGEGKRQLITSVCDVVNRDRFEREHENLCLDEINRFGFPAPLAGELHIVSPPEVSYPRWSPKNERTLNIRSIPDYASQSLGDIVSAVRPLCRFIKEVATVALASEVADECSVLSKNLQGPRAETLRLVGWLLLQPTDSCNKPVLSRFISLALNTYQHLNDIVMVLAVGAVAMFANDQSLNGLVAVPEYVRWSRGLLDMLRRLGMWQIAAEYVFLSPIPEIRSFSHSRTGLNLACGTCKRELDGVAEKCTKCESRTADCSLCGQTVKGLWVACQGCGHGGHAAHIHAWFSDNSVCPVADCAHECS